MIISESRKILVWAPPKTGTKTTRIFLEQNGGHHCNSILVREGKQDQHTFPVESREQELVAEHYAGWRMLITARNPYARIVSLYRHFKRKPRIPKEENKPVRTLAFRENFHDWIFTDIVTESMKALC